MKKIKSDELELLGSTLRDGKLKIDGDVCARINWLIAGVLRHVGVGRNSGGWDSLYVDPADGRYWLLTYPHGEMHGGGPPQLKCVPLTAEEIAAGFFSPGEWDEHMKKFMRERNIRFISREKLPRDKPG